ncbi:MAG TPA: methyltransferase [Firmicutes bacterium]|nr:methyltransferase [Bacillota bacterium]
MFLSNILTSYRTILNPIDKFVLDLIENENLGGWGIILFLLITLLTTILAGGIVGVERELHGHAAGLRTHVLIALGASLIMSLSIFAFPINEGYTRDPARLAAQVVSGIGFIGAGTIMQNGTGIRGLTTAASLWVCGGIGLACGSGFIVEGLLGAIATFSVLFLLVALEKRTSKKNPQISLIIEATTPALHVALEIAEKYNIKVKDINSSLLTYRQKDCLKMVITLKKPDKIALTTFVDELRKKTQPLDLLITHIKND